MKTAHAATALRLRACISAGTIFAMILTALPAAFSQTINTNPESVQLIADDEIVYMSVFEVADVRDHGYLRMNTATATRIGMEIQKVPLAMSAISKDFIEDTGMRDIQDILRYQPSASGDNRMGIVPPGNSATPRGTMTLRGFPISQRLRNGVFRYTGYSLDNVERVEISRGPAAIFYGVGYPGGVINYVTKKPQFFQIPTVLSYGYGGSGDKVGDQKVTVDQNTVLLKNQAAMRFVGSWNNIGGSKRDEFVKGFSINPSLVIKPLKNDKLVLMVEFEHTQFKRNQDDTTWTYNEQFFKDYNNPSDALLIAAGITGGKSNPDWERLWQTQGVGYEVWDEVSKKWVESTKVSYPGIGNREPAESFVSRSYSSGYGRWVSLMRTVLDDPYWIANTSASRGIWYTDLDGNRVHDDEFNFYGPGAYTAQNVNVLEVTVDLNPFDWLNMRYVYTNDDSSYESLTNSATPLANGYEFNTAGPSQRGDYRHSVNHQLDIVLKKEFLKIKHKLLAGGLFNESHQRYTGFGPYLYNNIPGAAEYDPSKPDNGTTNIPPWLNNYSWGLAWQTFEDRNGEKMTAYDLFARHDPALHVRPDVSRITRVDRSIVDAGKPRKWEGYISYMADALNDRLHFTGGYRWTFNYTHGGNRAASNPPWYEGYGFFYDAIDPEMWNAYGIGAQRGFTPFERNPQTGEYTMRPLPANSETLETYYLSSFQDTRGKSWMLGGGFDITKEVTVYISQSQTFRPQGSTGAIYSLEELKNRARLLGRDPDTEIARIQGGGADSLLGNEKGINSEIGVKTSLFNAQLVGTLALFRLDREGEALEDIGRNEKDPLNYLTDDMDPARVTTGIHNDPVYGKTQGIRWYSNGTKRRSEGIEFEIIWSPMRNFQMTASGSWIWKAKTLLDTSISPTATDQSTIDKRYYTYDFRMPGVSEYRLNAFGNYTLIAGPLRRLAIGLGVRYASEFNIQNSKDWDSKRGGLTGGDYVVCDMNIAYPWELFGFKLKTSLNVTNLFDQDYVEGGGVIGVSSGYNFAPRRTWMLTTSMTF